MEFCYAGLSRCQNFSGPLRNGPLVFPALVSSKTSTKIILTVSTNICTAMQNNLNNCFYRTLNFQVLNEHGIERFWEKNCQRNGMWLTIKFHHKIYLFTSLCISKYLISLLLTNIFFSNELLPSSLWESS